MAFWDFLRRLFGTGEPSEASRATAAPATTAPASAPTATVLPTSPAIKSATTPPAPPPQPSDFLPVSRGELLKGGEEVRRTTGWMWFGRRDIIPPASDLRTKLIDRGMLTQGLLTAEQSAEMHIVGEQHD